MNSIFFLLPIALLLGAIFALLFVKAVRDGQFDDLDSPGWSVLSDDESAAGKRPDDTEDTGK